MTQELANDIIRIMVKRIVKCDYTLQKEALRMATNKEDVLKIIIRLIQNNKCGDEQITELLELLPDQYAKIAEKGKRPTISNTQLNRDLLEVLKAANYISTYSTDGKICKVNTKRKTD